MTTYLIILERVTRASAGESVEIERFERTYIGGGVRFLPDLRDMPALIGEEILADEKRIWAEAQAEADI